MIAQAGFELRLLLRNGEQLLLTLVIPVALLVGITLVPAVPLDAPAGAARVPEALGGVLAVAIIASAFTSLAISVGFDRRSGALIMLATTPLSRQAILGARALAALAMVAIQVVLLAITALALGWQPTASALALLAWVVLGTASFAALGFALGGAVRAEATLAIANAAFLVLVAVGGQHLHADADAEEGLAGGHTLAAGVGQAAIAAQCAAAGGEGPVAGQHDPVGAGDILGPRGH